VHHPLFPFFISPLIEVRARSQFTWFLRGGPLSAVLTLELVNQFEKRWAQLQRLSCRGCSCERTSLDIRSPVNSRCQQILIFRPHSLLHNNPGQHHVCRWFHCFFPAFQAKWESHTAYRAPGWCDCLHCQLCVWSSYLRNVSVCLCSVLLHDKQYPRGCSEAEE